MLFITITNDEGKVLKKLKVEAPERFSEEDFVFEIANSIDLDWYTEEVK